MLEIVSDSAWLQAMLDVEAALAMAEARVGLIPQAAANEITAHCRADEFDVQQIGRDAAASANPVIPLVAALRKNVSLQAAQYVHRGATSQDILDTAMMLVARKGIHVMLEDLCQAAAATAELADRHRSTVMAARTLLQQASVTSFGLKAAGWLGAIIDARGRLQAIRETGLAVQFGGAVGTLAALGDDALKVASALADTLKLTHAPLPWHSNRTRMVELASTLGLAAGVAGKVALDVVLMAQTEVGEVHEGRRAGRGGSSALPQKQNPVDAIEILAAVRHADAQVGVLLGSMVQEHERAAGAWQAEWPALSDLLRYAGGAASRLASLLGSLEIDAENMRRNLELTGGLIMSESLVTRLAQHVDLVTARQLVEAAVSGADQSGRPFQDVLQHDDKIGKYLDASELAAALEPSNYLGASNQLIDRALAQYRTAREEWGGR